MKILLIACTVALLSLTASFRIEPDLIEGPLTATFTTFKIIYPQAHLSHSPTLTLRGDNCNLTWTKGISLKKNASAADTWTTSLLCPTNTEINVKVLINDTKWMMGANYKFIAQSDVDVIIYPCFEPTANKIYDSPEIRSTILGNSRKISIYYPPSFYDNTYKKYQLLVMHDGQNLFDPSKAAFGTAWLIQNTTNNLIVEGKIKEMIIVGVWNTKDRIDQYTYSVDPEYKQGGKGPLYLDFIEKELMPKLNNEYLKGRISQGRINIGGSSLGGLISCYAVYSRPSVYKSGICMSSSFWWNNSDFKGTILKQYQYNPSTTLYLDSGDSGQSQDNKASTDEAKAALIGKGYKENSNLYYYLDKGGQHSESYWGKRFWVPLTDLFGA